MAVSLSRVLPDQVENVRARLGQIRDGVRDGERLELGDRGPAVAALQRALRDAGVYAGEVDGVFDKQTRRAVLAFQRGRGLNATGRVGPKFLRALRENLRPVADRFEEPARRGEAGRDILRAERRLAALGFDTGEVDGVFDKDTQKAVMAFCADHPELFDAKGRLDQQVWQALIKEYRHQVIERHPNSGALRPGETGKDVRKLERQLGSIGYDVGREDNRYTAATAAAVADFQQRKGLEVTGQVNARTAAAIEKAAHVADRIDTIKEANRFFVSQWGPTRFNSASASKYGFSDCAPTSALMAASALGIIAHPSRDRASKAIDRMRDRQRGYNTDYSASTTYDQLKRGLRASGAAVNQISGWQAIDRALEKGHTLVAAGNPWQAWGARMRKNGEYLNSRDPGNHSIAVLGKTKDGKYLVADPLSSTGVIAVSREALARFLKDGSGGVFEVRRPKTA